MYHNIIITVTLEACFLHSFGHGFPPRKSPSCRMAADLCGALCPHGVQRCDTAGMHNIQPWLNLYSVTMNNYTFPLIPPFNMKVKHECSLHPRRVEYVDCAWYHCIACNINRTMVPTWVRQSGRTANSSASPSTNVFLRLLPLRKHLRTFSLPFHDIVNALSYQWCVDHRCTAVVCNQPLSAAQDPGHVSLC